MNVRLKSIAVAISLACSAGLAQAQNDQSSDLKQVSYVTPQKPEDISPLLNGEKIPVTQLPDVSGKIFDLNKAVSEKPTVLIFYRGGWCPYCSKQLSGLRQTAPELEKLGYQLIAVSTDAPEGLMESAKKESLTFTLLSDADLSFSKQFGLAYKAPMGYWETLLKSTHGKDIDLLLPVPSVYILDKKGVIQFEYINPDFKQRMNADLLKTVAATIKKDL
ncbi:peroxiredoxin-like family protein [Niastella yeongjuensis]|nr:peroxiredoxin-like family protein [Niastella yeongjuensis]SEO28065.1 Peroxiredoxin [Niastella yeongjuensis]